MKNFKTKLYAVALAVCLSITSVSVVTPANTTTVQAKKTYVYVASSGRGKCYHSSKYCSNMKAHVIKYTVKKAKKLGFRACSKCYR